MGKDRHLLYKVLLVGTQPPDIATLTTMLIKQDYDVQATTTRLSACEITLAWSPDLILLTTNPLDTDGLAFIKWIRANDQVSGIPVICVIPRENLHTCVQVFAVGGTDYVMTPLHEGEVLARIKTQLKLRAMQKQLADWKTRLEQEECQRTEDDLREKRDLDSAILDTAGALIVVLDKQGRIVRFNKAFERTTSYSQKEVMGQYIWDRFLVPDDIEAVKDVFTQLKSGDYPNVFENFWVTKDGEHRLIDWSNTALLEEQGQVAYIIGIGIDVTESRRTDEVLQKLSFDLGVHVKELECLYAISALVEKPGIKLDEILLGTVELIPRAYQYPQITSAQIILGDQAFRTANFHETPWQQKRNIWVDGRQAGYIQVCFLELKQNGNQESFLDEEKSLISAIAQRLGKIIERMQAQEALRYSEELYTLAQQSANIGSWDWDIVTGDLRWTAQVEPMFGFDFGEFGATYEAFLESVHPEDREYVVASIAACVKQDEVYAITHRIVWPDGTVRWVSETGTAIRDKDGKAIRMLGIVQDITDHELTEQALRKARELSEVARREELARRREAERRRRIAENLADVLVALNSEQPLEKVLDYIAVQARQALENQAVVICQLNEETDILSIKVAQGLPTSSVNDVFHPTAVEILKQAAGVRQVVAMPDLTSTTLSFLPDAELHSPDVSDFDLYRAMLAVPIVIQDKVYGGILLYYAQPRLFQDEEIELAAIYGEQVTLAVENAQLREQVRQSAVTAERSRLARDLHDSVTQALFSASLVAEVLPQVWKRDPQDVWEGLEELRQLTRGALAEMRTLLLELRPTALAQTRLEELLVQLTEAVTSRTEISVVLNVDPIPQLPAEVHVTLYRVAQEALQNVVKHAGANQVTVSLQAYPPMTTQQAGNWRGKIVFCVSDDGQGFDQQQFGPDQFGLDIMHERAMSVGGSLTIESIPGHGTQVIFVWETA